MRIILPLSLPMLATLTLFYGVGYWNMFMSVILYINKTNLQNLTVIVQGMPQIQGNFNMSAMDMVQRRGNGIRKAESGWGYGYGCAHACGIPVPAEVFCQRHYARLYQRLAAIMK